MKHTVEPILAIIVSLLSWQAWKEIVLTLVLALVTGALGYLGKYLMQRLVSHCNDRKKESDES